MFKPINVAEKNTAFILLLQTFQTLAICAEFAEGIVC
jgi:hypothetical protein